MSKAQRFICNCDYVRHRQEGWVAQVLSHNGFDELIVAAIDGGHFCAKVDEVDLAEAFGPPIPEGFVPAYARDRYLQEAQF